MHRGKHLPVLAAAILMAACSAPKPVAMAGKVIKGTVSTAGSMAVSAAETGGKTALTTVSTAGTVGKGAVSAVGSLGSGNVVTFVNKSTGVVKQLPWAQGLHLFAASQSAKIEMAGQAIHVIRGSQIIETSWDQIKGGTTRLDLKPGDLVELTRLTSR